MYSLLLGEVKLDTYTHVTNKMQQEAAEKMGGFMEMVM